MTRTSRGRRAQWPIRELPRWLQVLVAGVVAGYCVAICASVAATRVQAGQLRLFAILLACSAAAVGLTRRMGEPVGVVRDVYAMWDLPTAVLLPPLYVLLAPVPRMVLTQVRMRQTALHRRAYTAAAVGLAYAAASLAFHAVVPILGPGAGTGTGGHAMAWTVLVAGCGLIRLVVNDGLVFAAVKGSAPETRLLAEIAGAEAVYGNVAELCLGTLAAFAAVHSTLALVYAVPLVITLQRSLRHAQLVSETRVDGKTGLLNDRTWHREAAGEVARAVRTRTPLALGIVDVDHFKAVNDTYGHLAGDAVLSAVAAAMTALLRPYDLIGRVGGEEFSFLLPNTPVPEAVEIAERLREKIPLALPHEDPAGPMLSQVTVSVGVAAADQPAWDLGRYYSLADQALYAAKQSGRNAVWVISTGQPDLKPRPSHAARASKP
jgi:diguanylate cyclase (GGDEF)-like protein